MSEAPHQPSPAAPKVNNTPMERQDQAPTGTSQENSSPSLGSEAVAEFGSSDETLRPPNETREQEGNNIGDHVKIGTLPVPDYSLPGISLSEPQRAAEDIHTESELQTSSLGQNGELANEHPETQAETMTFNTAEFTLDRGEPEPFLEGNEFTSRDPHQRFEDGMRTPPRRLITGEQSDPSFTSTSSFNRRQKRRQRLFDACKTGLFYTLTRGNGKTQPKTAVLNLVALQRMNIHGLQAELARYATEIFENDSFDFDESEDRQNLLNLYCDAVRNLDFMREKEKLGYDGDPFLIKSSRALERDVLEARGLIPGHLLPKGDLPPPYDYKHPLLSNASGRHHANEMTMKKQRPERFAMASFGGLLIIVPMLIMANVPGKVASLVTSCVAIIIFAGLITLGTKLGPHEVLASVAAYAAVLVVFVGLSLEKG
ncbi:hypothetical protein KC330_g5369 [Hortaea werneckii]|nr:hypothetical protein KC330_g5369 [Hortaea werneckii]